MARKLAYILFYDNNVPERVFGRHVRCAAFDSFFKAHDQLADDVDYFMSKGAHIQNEWYNDSNINFATSCEITLRMPDGELMNLNIVPSVIN